MPYSQWSLRHGDLLPLPRPKLRAEVRRAINHRFGYKGIEAHLDDAGRGIRVSLEPFLHRAANGLWLCRKIILVEGDFDRRDVLIRLDKVTLMDSFEYRTRPFVEQVHSLACMPLVRSVPRYAAQELAE